MARPKPNIILENINPRTYKAEQILEADAIYAVFYKGKPINLRTLSHLVSYPGPKYKKVSFSNSGHAFNLAEKLNKIFKTTDFSVYKLNDGVVCKEIED
ncbi:MAG TPA: hypothetical protein VIY47_11595 [Ignavibacteriaceae bacterium]